MHLWRVIRSLPVLMLGLPAVVVIVRLVLVSMLIDRAARRDRVRDVGRSKNPPP